MLLLVVLLVAGCVYTPEKKVATEYILRPNADGDVTEWGSYTDINEDVGVLGDITSVDTNRLASWGVTTAPWLDMETGGISGVSGGSPVTHKIQEILWEDYPGSNADRISSLKFRWGSWSVDVGAGNAAPTAPLDVYLNDELIETIDVTAAQGFIGTEPWDVHVRETEVVLPRLYRPSEINTLETKLRTIVTGYVFWVYSLECRTVTSEKDTEKDINPSDGGEKHIEPYVALEK